METSQKHQITITIEVTPEWREKANRTSWGMYTPEGSKMVSATFIGLVTGGVIISPTSNGLEYDFGKAVFDAVDIIVSPTHSEVNDTECREAIWSIAESLLK